MKRRSFFRTCVQEERSRIREARKLARKSCLSNWINEGIKQCSVSRHFPFRFEGSGKTKSLPSYKKVDPDVDPLRLVENEIKGQSYVVFDTFEEVGGIYIIIKQANVSQATRRTSGHTMLTSFMEIGSIFIHTPRIQEGESWCGVTVDPNNETLVKNIIEDLGIKLTGPRRETKKTEEGQLVFKQDCKLL